MPFLNINEKVAILKALNVWLETHLTHLLHFFYNSHLNSSAENYVVAFS